MKTRPPSPPPAAPPPPKKGPSSPRRSPRAPLDAPPGEDAADASRAPAAATAAGPTPQARPDPPEVGRRRRRHIDAAQLAAHPLVGTAEARALEVPLAAVMAGHPRAEHAVDVMVDKFTALLAAAHEDSAQLFASIDARGEPRYRQAGDVGRQHTETVLREGNLRERLNALGPRAQRAMLTLLERLAGEADEDPGLAAALRRDHGLDVDALVRHLDVMERYLTPHLLSGHPRGSVARQDRMREVRPGAAHGAIDGTTWANRRNTTQMTPPWSEREIEHAFEGARLALRKDPKHAPKMWPDEDRDTVSFRMPHRDGSTILRARSQHSWHRQSRAGGMPTRNAISGTAYRLSAMQRILDPNPARAHDFVMALVGHLVPLHHTYHEVMAAVAELGDAYDPSPGGMLAHAREVLASHPPPKGAQQADNLEALRRTIDEVERALAQKEEG